MMKLNIHLAILVILVVLVTACGGPEEPVPTSTEKPPPTATSTSTSTPVPTDTPTLVPTPEPTPTQGPLSPEEIFTMIGPSVVFIETAAMTGSGMIIDGNYIVTNAHVVWPFEEARVVFPDGTEHEDVAVLSWDLLGDLAVLGPLDSDAEPIELADGEDLSIGSEVYLIGYPGEVDKYPEPTITRGLISRVREWDPAEITYFQTDATIGGGQSGGVMVTEYGDVIGISGMSFSEADFGLVASASDLVSRIEGLIAGEDVSGFGQRKIPTDGGLKSHDFVNFAHEWDSQVYVLYEHEGTEIELEADSDSANVGMYVVDVGGYWVMYADDGFKGREAGSFTTEFEAPYFVDLFNYSPYSQMASISASRRLIPLVDLDDGRGIAPEQTKPGNLDYPGDSDHFTLVLDEGAKINILVDSMMFDPYLIIARPGDGEEQIVQDDDTGGGIFGTNAEMTFIAPDPGAYLLIVQDSYGYNIGGYSIQIREPYAAGPTAMAPMPTAIPELGFLPGYGAMFVYRSSSGPFSLEYPADWTNDPSVLGDYSEICMLTTACFVGDSLLAIAEEDLTILGDPSLDEYVDLYLSTNLAAGSNLVSREDFTTLNGLTGVVVTLDFGGILEMRRFMYIHDGQGFSASYFITDDVREIVVPIVDYSFGSFEVD